MQLCLSCVSRKTFERQIKSLAIAGILAGSFAIAGCGGNAMNHGSMPLAASPTVAAPPPAAPAPPPAATPAPAPAGMQIPASAQTYGNIQEQSGWQWCTQKLNGSVCAAGVGKAISWMAPHQTTPSLDGSSAQFFIGGSTGYSNALWWRSLGANSAASHFVYDVWFYLDDAAAAQALEFDANQTTGGTRWVFGTECNINGSHRWDVWDGTKGAWVTSSVPCHPFQPKTWIHLTWNFERVNDKVHYVSVALNGVASPVEMYLGAQKNYSGEDVSIAFQMDGDFRQHSYSTWLDKLTLSAW